MTERSLRVWDETYRSLIKVKGMIESATGEELSMSETLNWMIDFFCKEDNPQTTVGNAMKNADIAGPKVWASLRIQVISQYL